MNLDEARFGGARYIHEVAFAVNLAFVSIGLFFLYAPDSLKYCVGWLEPTVNGLLGIRQTDFVTGYWEFFIPGTALTICIWIALRLSRRTSFARQSLRYAGGIVALSGAPVLWLCMYYLAERRYGWTPLRAVQFYELAAAVSCLIVYFLRRWPIRPWGSVALLFAHYAFWLWQFRGIFNTLVRGWGGTVAIIPFAALCAGLAWAFYMHHLGSDILFPSGGARHVS
jgi:hypothetical protein